ncbi:hypothetical protein LTR27_008412 [Elasticomyces elasticus]|nr:hypothetical protein LTR27_008412 [Elasticomyces elasticus]
MATSTERSLASAENASWQYHEPWAWTSICSEAGLKWVLSVTGNRDFFAAAKQFTNDIVQTPAHEATGSSDRAPTIISESMAWEYTNAFYDDSWEANLGVIDRQDFEMHLQAYHGNQKIENESAWFALRNTVFACGYRSLLAKDPSTSFATSQAEAGRYFKNALSVLSAILVPPSSLIAVRALTLMACYAEGLGQPTLKHVLCSNAVHLAQSKGLHRQPDKTWGSGEDDRLKRISLWWVLYAFEKYFALFDGRPSAIDDDNVSVQMPAISPSGNYLGSLCFSLGIRVSRIQSRMSRSLFSFKTLSLSVGELMAIVSQLDAQLKQLLEEIPLEYIISVHSRTLFSPQRLIEALFLHFTIHGTIMAVHAHFFYPWMCSRFAVDGYDAALEAQIASSSAIVAEAARKIILGLRMVSVNATMPSWLGVQYPLCAVINLFIYILKYPALTTASGDLGLLDTCAGHFGLIDYLTSSQISIVLPREAVNVASRVVRAAQTDLAKTNNHDTTSAGNAARAPTHGPNSESLVSDEILALDSAAHSLMDGNDMSAMLDFDWTGWNLLSSFDMLDPNGMRLPAVT